MKQILPFLFFISIQVLGNGQSVDWVVSPDYFAGQEDGKSVSTDKSGNVYIGSTYSGYYYSAIGAIITKYSVTGIPIWSDTIENVLSIRTTTDLDGNLYAIGRFSPTATFGAFNLSTSGAGFIVKYNTTGTCQWAKATPNAYGDDIKVCPNGDIVFIGNYQPASIGHMYIGAISPTGSVLWTSPQSYGWNSSNGRHSIAVDSNNNIYACGMGRPDTTSNDWGFISKFDQLGNQIWAEGIEAWPKGLALDCNGDVYIVGYFNHTINIGSYSYSPSCSVCYTSFITKFSSYGNVSWVNFYQSTSLSQTEAIAIHDEKLYVVGVVSGEMNFISQTAVTSCQISSCGTLLYFLELDTSGIFQSVSLAEGQGSNISSMMPHAIYSDNKGLYIAGYVTDSAKFLNKPIGRFNARTLFLTKLFSSINTFVSDLKFNTESTLSVYPNPSSGLFQIYYSSGEKNTLQLNIINSNGEKIYSEIISQPVKECSIEIDLSRHSKGTYFVEIIANKKRSVKKIVLN